MATIISHPAIPITMALVLGNRQISWRLLLVAIVCTMLPDLDVIAFRFEIPYTSSFGHRGFTHSLLFAVATGLAFSLLAKQLHARALTTFLFVTFATASHGFLDALTTGGNGIAFFWPFADERYFLPWQFIRVSPIGLENFLTYRGWITLKSELLTIWLPCALLAAATQLLRLKRHHARPARID
jgi:inner membrane protein